MAQELHDEVGQTLTAVLLDLERVARQAPPALREQVHEVQENTRAGLDEVRRIARRLRPGVLDELGLTRALKSLTGEFTGPGLTVRHHLDADLPALGRARELVLYRVAQESLTNTARHAHACRADLALPNVALRLLVQSHMRPHQRVHRNRVGAVGPQVRTFAGQQQRPVAPGRQRCIHQLANRGDRREINCRTGTEQIRQEVA